MNGSSRSLPTATLGEMKDGYSTINALAEPVKRDPDRWIPIISKLIGHSDRDVHNAAALCLAQFVNRRARKDALLPLLPWLSDPQWAVTSDEYARVRLAESVGRLKMREALPGLIWIIRNEGPDKGYDLDVVEDRSTKEDGYIRQSDQNAGRDA